jgi:hypothetical protein
MDAADLVEKSDAEGWKRRRASNFRRSLIDGGRVLYLANAMPCHHPLSGQSGEWSEGVTR